MTVRVDMKALAAVKYMMRHVPESVREVFRQRFPEESAAIDSAPSIVTREIVGDVVIH
jgi:hypothetical protein